MTTYAKPEWYFDGESFPYVEMGGCFENEVKYHPCDETLYRCYQPDEFEDHEFNLLINIDGRWVFARGIHFDFVEL